MSTVLDRVLANVGKSKDEDLVKAHIELLEGVLQLRAELHERELLHGNQVHLTRKIREALNQNLNALVTGKTPRG